MQGIGFIDRIAHFGVKSRYKSEDRKNIILLNWMNIILFLLMGFIFLLELALYFITGNELSYGSYRIILIGMTGFINLVLSRYHLIGISKFSLIVFPGFILGFFPTLFGHILSEFFIYVPFGIVAMSIIPHFILSYQKERKLYKFAVLFFLIELMTHDVFMMLAADSEPAIVPVLRADYLFIKISHLVLFLFINLSVFYLRKQNNKYESQLEESYNWIKDKNAQIEEQSDELEQQNEELREQREESQSQNEELIAYQEEIHAKNETLSNALKDLKETQAKLIESEKMASIGVLTTGIAHEINNPINFINAGIDGLNNILEQLLNYIDRYEEIFPKCKKMVQEEIETLREEINYQELKQGLSLLTNDIKKGIDRTNEIIKGLYTFARTDEDEKQICSVDKIIDSSLTLLYSQYKNRITIEKQYEYLPEMKCYPGKLGQVFLNVLTNAIQSIEGEGTICISTTKALKNDHIIVKVKDTGKGISREHQEKIFEPFFTTKEIGKGTGLGLSISYNIIKKHDGSIKMDSDVGKGTSVAIELPLN